MDTPTPLKLVRKSRRLFTGVRSSTSLPVAAEMIKILYVFMQCFSPVVITRDIENSLQKQLRLTSLIFSTMSKSKFNSYVWIHMLVMLFDSIILRKWNTDQTSSTEERVPLISKQLPQLPWVGTNGEWGVASWLLLINLL
jgi:hypothetical protein